MHPQIFSTFVTRKPGFARGFRRAAWMGAAAAVTAVTGCGPQLQTQIVGRSTAFAGAPNPSAPAVAAEIPVPESGSAQVLHYVVSMPHAVQLHYQVTCPSAEREGTMGETFDHYRTRRLAELERERRAQAHLIASFVGAVAPPVRADGTVAGPGGSATVTGEVNPGAAAEEAARQSLPPPSLPPGDVGAAVVRGTVDLGASPAGRCALTLTTDPPAQDASGAQVFLELVRLVDVEAEERARQAAFRAEQDKRALALRVWLLGSLQRAGADPMARARARVAAQARADEDARRRSAAADEENRRRQAAADEESRKRQAAADEENRKRQAAATEENQRRREAEIRADQERWREEQARLAKANAARAKAEQEAAARSAVQSRARQAAFSLRLQLLVQLQRLGADPMARARARAAAQALAEQEARRRAAAADEENRRRQAAADEESRRRQEAAARAEQERLRREQEHQLREQERLRREQAEAAERERREAPERERRANEERTRLAREEADRQARLAREEADRQARLAKEEADRQARIAADQARVAREYEIRLKAEREAAERRAREWRARQAAFALRWQLLAGLQRRGADPLRREHLEEARVAARMEEQRRQYEIRAKRDLDVVVARRTAIDLRFGLLARLAAMGADPDFRRKRDEAMFRDMDAEARRLEASRTEAAERVRWETQAAIDLRVLAKLRLRQLGAVDRPTCPPPPVETPPPAPFASATWIQGRYDWNGIAWVWASGHYERPPEAGVVWVPPAQIAVSGTLVVRPGRWVRITVGPPR